MIAHRAFPDYETYVYRQGGKARNASGRLQRHLAKNTESFARMFLTAKPHLKPGSVLCLGARTGAESQGALRAGFPGSVGIDLHPAGPTVIQGDWHQLPFADRSFNNAYSNSLDHCFDLEKLASEIYRVLDRGGRFYLMATNRAGKTAESWIANTKTNEALYWDSSADLSAAICAYGFTEVHAWRDGKWGHHILRSNRGKA